MVHEPVVGATGGGFVGGTFAVGWTVGGTVGWLGAGTVGALTMALAVEIEMTAGSLAAPFALYARTLMLCVP